MPADLETRADSLNGAGVLVRATDITVHAGGAEVLRRVNLEIRRGEIVTLIGPNGAGKSSLVRIIVGLARPANGTLELRAGLRIGYVPQHFYIDSYLPVTVQRFLELADRRLATREAIARVLTEVGLPAVARQPMQALSGGESRRVLLARALLRDPDLLVLDEPTAGVDVTGQAELYNLISSLRAARQCGVLMVSHDLHLVMAATDHVTCLSSGHVCCSGHPEAVSQHPEYLALFGPQLAPSLAVYTHHHDHRHDLSGQKVPICQDDDHDGCSHE